MALGAAVVIAVVMAFLLLPIVALVTYQPVHDLIDGFGTKVATDAILVSLKTNAIAFALMIAFGHAVRLRRSPGGAFRGRSVVITLVEMPLVMPPAVAGPRPAGRVRPPRAARAHADGASGSTSRSPRRPW